MGVTGSTLQGNMSRSLEAYWEYARIDVKERVADSAEHFCKKRVKRREPDPEEQPKRRPAAAAAPAKLARRPLRAMLSWRLPQR